MKRKLLKTLLVAAGMVMGTNVFSANVTLTDNLEVTGYVTAHYYDLNSHTIDGEAFSTEEQTTFTGLSSNNVYWRDSYALFNYASGSRTFNIEQNVSKNDLIIIEGYQTGAYGISFSVSNSEAITLANINDKYYCYKITSEASNLAITLNRSNYISAILIMTPDENADGLAVAKANYESTITAYNQSIEVETDNFIDDNKLFWHPTSAISTLENNINDIKTKFSAACVDDDETDITKFEEATTTISNLIKEIETTVNTYNNSRNMPEIGKYYALKHSYSNQYMTFNASAASLSEEIRFVTLNEANANRVYITFVNELKLQVSHSGSDNWSLFGSTANGGSNSSEWLFIPQNDTEYRIQTPTQSRYIGGTTSLVGNKKDTDTGILWTIEEVSSLPINISSTGFATYCPTAAIDMTGAETIEAYAATDYADGVLSLTKVSTVAAGEGVLLRALGEGAATEQVPVIAATDKTAGNLFVGVTETIESLATEGDGVTNFILNNVEGIGFYLANNQKVAAGKAYLALPGYNNNGEAKKITMSFGTTDGISEISAESNTANTAVYTISGLRVEKPTKGLYIVNGKKVVVK